MVVKDLAKAVDALANAEAFLRQTKVQACIAEADKVRTRVNAVTKLREQFTGGRK